MISLNLLSTGDLIRKAILPTSAHYICWYQALEIHYTVQKVSTSLNQLILVSSLPTAMSVCQDLPVSDELQLLEKEYMVVAMSTLASLQQGRVPTSFIYQQILSLPHQTMKAKYQKLVDKRATVLSSTSTKQLFLSFAPYCDFLNPDMLEHIVDRFGDEISGSIIAMYLKRLREFRKRTVLGDIAGRWVAITPPGYVELSLEMDSVWERRTLEDLEVFRTYPSRMPWFFKRVNMDGFRVVFSVPKGVWLYQDDLDNLRKNRVLSVMEGNRCVVDLGTQSYKNEVSPENTTYRAKLVTQKAYKGPTCTSMAKIVLV